jgi:hypothetical protein
LNATPDDRLTSFLAWRRRRALEAGITKPEQILDEWVFRRIVLQEPKDIYALEDLRLLTAPLFAQYGEDLLAICQRRPTIDERPRSSRSVEETESVTRPIRTTSRLTTSRSRRVDATSQHVTVRRDSPTVTLHSSQQSQKRVITDFVPSDKHGEWLGRSFEFNFSTSSFKFWETEFLENWGTLLDDIASGAVAPESTDELAVADLTSRSRKATKEWETAWVKVVLRRAYENQ